LLSQAARSSEGAHLLVAQDRETITEELRSVFIAASSVDEMQIEASFCAAIRIAREQKSVSLQKRAEATYAEYLRQKASRSGGHEFRLPLW